MQIGMFLKNHVAVAMIVMCNNEKGKYKVQYDKFYKEEWGLGYLPVGQIPYYIDRLPTELYDQMKRVESTELARLRGMHPSIDDFELWLLCCDLGLISDGEGYRM